MRYAMLVVACVAFHGPVSAQEEPGTPPPPPAPTAPPPAPTAPPPAPTAPPPAPVPPPPASPPGMVPADQAEAPPPPVTAPTRSRDPLHLTEGGLRVDAKMAYSTTLLGLGSSAIPFGTAVPQLLIGYQGDRVAFLVGAGLFRYSDKKNDLTSFVLAPTLIVDLARSHDLRAALYLLGAIGVGASITSSNSDSVFMSSSKTTNMFDVEYQLAIGARYWLGRNFGLGAEAGLSGNFVNVDDSDRGYAFTALYGAMVGSYVAR